MEKINNYLSKHADKVMHFAVCAVLTVYGALVDFSLGVFLPIFVGVMKEVIDGVRRDRSGATDDTNRFIDWGDILADFLGMAVVAVPLYFIMF